MLHDAEGVGIDGVFDMWVSGERAPNKSGYRTMREMPPQEPQPTINTLFSEREQTPP